MMGWIVAARNILHVTQLDFIERREDRNLRIV